MTKLVIFTTGALLIAATQAALAKPPHTPDLTQYGNRWTITAYDDTNPAHRELATQGICFFYVGDRGTHQQYYWVSDTFPDWNGRASQEGDQVFMHGDYAANIGHDGMTWQLTTDSRGDEGFGHWHEWREDIKYGRTIGFANTKLRRVGNCRTANFDSALLEGEKIELKVNNQGERIITPYGLTETEIEQLK